MSKKNRRTVCLLVSLVLVLSAVPDIVSAQVTVTKNSPSTTIQLNEWKIAPSVDGAMHFGLPVVPENSDPALMSDDGWLPAVAQSTVLGNLIDAGMYDHLFVENADGKKDVYFADNMSKIPFDDFLTPWWYSTQFTLPASEAGKNVLMTLKGLNYYAKIWVNGKELSNELINVTSEDELLNRYPALPNPADAPSDPYAATYSGANLTAYQGNTVYKLCDAAGAPYKGFSDYSGLFIGPHRTFEVDLTALLNPAGVANDVKILISRPQYYQSLSDFTYFWVDWNPQPMDAMMGLTGEVLLTTSGDVRLSNPAVSSKVSDSLDSAAVTFYVDLSNFTGNSLTGKLSAAVKGPDGNEAMRFEEDVTVKGGAYCQEVSITKEFGGNNLKLWWPYKSGDQPLYTVDYTFTPTGQPASDSLSHRFGIRQIETEINMSEFMMQNGSPQSASSDANMMQLYVNHRPILLEGGAYCPTDLFLRHSQSKNESIVEYLKYMGMNMVRDEGKFFDNNLLDLFDENGILYLTGWCCCDRLQAPADWTKAERFVAYEMQYSKIRELRSHPSMALWYNGSDWPAASGTTSGMASSMGNARYYNGMMVEQKYLEILAKLHWEDMGNITSSGSARASRLTNVSGGQHMDGCYDIQTPTYYYVEPAGLFGFISEGGGGTSLPVIESVRKMLPAENIWPYNKGKNFTMWHYHTARNSFNNIGNIVKFIDNTYGQSYDIEEFLMRAQVYEYDAHRAQFEAQQKNRYKSTSGVVSWMLNTAWPIFQWNLIDYYMNPTGSTFGARKANEPVHIMYDVFNKEILVLNSTQQDQGTLTASATLYDIDGNVISDTLEKDVFVKADGVSRTVAYNPSSTAIPYGPKQIGLKQKADGSFEEYTYNFFGKIEEAYGVNLLWNNDDIKNALTAPTTNVYFLRLELRDDSGKVVSYNSYAVPMKNDITSIANKDWNRAGIYQSADLTLLNHLPAVDLTLEQTGSIVVSDKINDKVVQTIIVKNNSDAIAYGVELKAYTSLSKKELVAPALYDDNMFTLYPYESRVITIAHNQKDLAGDAAIAVTCYNNVVNRASERSPNLRSSVSLTAGLPGASVVGSATANTVNATSPGSIPAANQWSVGPDNVRDSNLMTAWTSANDDQSPWIYANFGESKSFDRVVLRWNVNNATGGGNGSNHEDFAGSYYYDVTRFPNEVYLETSSSPQGPWTQIAHYDNSGACSVMNDIVLPSTATAQYLRVSPRGLRPESPAVGLWPANSTPGLMPYRSGVAAVPAVRAFSLAGFEVYAFRNSVFLDIQGDGAVNAGSKDYTAGMNANERVLTLDGDGTVTLELKRGYSDPDDNMIDVVLRDGVDISGSIGADNKIRLDGITGDTNISVLFGVPLPYNVLSLSADNVSYIGGDVCYTLSIANANNVLNIELEFEIDGSLLSGKGIAGLNGFGAMNNILWVKGSGNLWKGTVTLALPSGSTTGLKSKNPVDIAQFIFAPKGFGNAVMTLTGAKVVGFDEDTTKYLESTIDNGTATTIIAKSKYDLNRDGTVDALDLGIMLLYCGFSVDVAGWDDYIKVNDIWGNGVAASMCDVNGDGIIDMLDLLDLFIHYTK